MCIRDRAIVLVRLVRRDRAVAGGARLCVDPRTRRSDPSDVRVRHHRVALRVLQHLRGQYGAAVQESRALAGLPLWGEGVHCTEFDRQSAVGMAGVLGDFSGLASILHQALQRLSGPLGILELRAAHTDDVQDTAAYQICLLYTSDAAD